MNEYPIITWLRENYAMEKKDFLRRILHFGAIYAYVFKHGSLPMPEVIQRELDLDGISSPVEEWAESLYYFVAFIRFQGGVLDVTTSS